MSLEKTRFNPSILVKVWHNRKPYWPFPQSRYIFKRVKTSWMSCIIYQQVYSVIKMYKKVSETLGYVTKNLGTSCSTVT